MRSLNGSIHTTQTPPPLSFYNTFKESSFACLGFSSVLQSVSFYFLTLSLVIT